MPRKPSEIVSNISKMARHSETGKIRLRDTRKIDKATGASVTDKTKMDVSLDPELAKEIISKAKKNGIDPYMALAMAHQESSFGNEVGLRSNPFHVSLTNDGEVKLSDISEKGSVQVFMDLFKKKMETAKRLGKTSDEFLAQSWNGLGTISGRGSYYGIDTNKQPLNMATDPRYGKRVVDLRDNVIKKSPELVNLVNSTK